MIPAIRTAVPVQKTSASGSAAAGSIKNLGDFQEALAGFLKAGASISPEIQATDPEARNTESRQVSADAVKNLTSAAAQMPASLLALAVPVQGPALAATDANAAVIGSASPETEEPQKADTSADNKLTDPTVVNGPKKVKSEKASGDVAVVVTAPVPPQQAPVAVTAAIPGLPFFAGQQMDAKEEIKADPASADPASTDASKDAAPATTTSKNDNVGKDNTGVQAQPRQALTAGTQSERPSGDKVSTKVDLAKFGQEVAASNASDAASTVPRATLAEENVKQTVQPATGRSPPRGRRRKSKAQAVDPVSVAVSTPSEPQPLAPESCRRNPCMQQHLRLSNPKQ